MKVYLQDQQHRLQEHLDQQKTATVMAYDKGRIKQKVSTITLDVKKHLGELDLDFLFAYQIFPRRILTFKSQWEAEKRLMHVGDTIVQQVYLPPLRTMSLKIVFGVRVNRIIDEPTKKGFSYETLEGHAEKGESAFTIEEDDGKLTFKIETYSTGGNFLARLGGPVLTRPYQAFCTQKALQNVKRQIEAQS